MEGKSKRLAVRKFVEQILQWSSGYDEGPARWVAMWIARGEGCEGQEECKSIGERDLRRLGNQI